jgi:hypothetical protein
MLACRGDGKAEEAGEVAHALIHGNATAQAAVPTPFRPLRYALQYKARVQYGIAHIMWYPQCHGCYSSAANECQAESNTLDVCAAQSWQLSLALPC